MPKHFFQIMGSSGMTLGTVLARTKREALRAWAQERGYDTFAEYADATNTMIAEHDGHFRITLK